MKNQPDLQQDKPLSKSELKKSQKKINSDTASVHTEESPEYGSTTIFKFDPSAKNKPLDQVWQELKLELNKLLPGVGNEKLVEFSFKCFGVEGFCYARKDETDGSLAAAQQRPNPASDNIGIDVRNEVTSKLMVDEAGHYYYFIMQGDKVVNQDEVVKKGLRELTEDELGDFGLAPFTLNPGSVIGCFKDQKKTAGDLTIIIDPELQKSYNDDMIVTNNFGHRELSIAMSKKSYMDCAKKMIEDNGYAIAQEIYYGGSYPETPHNEKYFTINPEVYEISSRKIVYEQGLNSDSIFKEELVLSVDSLMSEIAYYGMKQTANSRTRVEDSLEFLGLTQDAVESQKPLCVISAKPYTSGSFEASNTRFDPTTEEYGTDVKHEVKSVLMTNQKGTAFYYFLTQGDKVISKQQINRLGLRELYDKEMEEFGLAPFTLNPGSVIEAMRRKKIPSPRLNIVIDPDLKDQDKHPYLTNNLGSRFLSITASTKYYLDCVDKVINKPKGKDTEKDTGKDQINYQKCVVTEKLDDYFISEIVRFSGKEMVQNNVKSNETFSYIIDLWTQNSIKGELTEDQKKDLISELGGKNSDNYREAIEFVSIPDAKEFLKMADEVVSNFPEAQKELCKKAIIDLRRMKNVFDDICRCDQRMDSEVIVSPKPATEGCNQAAQERFNPKTKQYGVHPEQEVKSMLMLDNLGRYHYFIMSGNKEVNLQHTNLESLDLKKVDLTEGILAEYTLNPSTVMSYLESQGKGAGVFVTIDPDLQKTKHEYLTNNFGSRLLSVSMRKDNYLRYITDTIQSHKFDIQFESSKFTHITSLLGKSSQQTPKSNPMHPGTREEELKRSSHKVNLPSMTGS